MFREIRKPVMENVTCIEEKCLVHLEIIYDRTCQQSLVENQEIKKNLLSSRLEKNKNEDSIFSSNRQIGGECDDERQKWRSRRSSRCKSGNCICLSY